MRRLVCGNCREVTWFGQAQIDAFIIVPPCVECGHADWYERVTFPSAS